MAGSGKRGEARRTARAKTGSKTRTKTLTKTISASTGPVTLAEAKCRFSLSVKRPLRVISGLPAQDRSMSALLPKADIRANIA